MQVLYLFSLVFGGIFVGLSVLSGLAGEAEVEADAEADLDVEADVDADGDFDAGAEAEIGGVDGVGDVEAGDLGDVDVTDLPFDFDLEGAGLDADVDSSASASPGEYEVSAQRTFNPLLSFKFYTFALAFFGLTGLLLQGTGLWQSTVGVFVVASVMGLGSGLAVAWAMHSAETGGDRVTERDYLGASAEVVLPVEADEPGKVRLKVQGRTVDLRARGFHDGETFEADQTCFVMDVDDEMVEVVDVETVQKQLLDGG